MPWPEWIDALRDRYLADAGHVFLLHGAIDARCEVQGELLDAQEVLLAFLSRTRQVMGVIRPSPSPSLTFPHLGDRGRYERLIAAHEVVTGTRLPRKIHSAEDALGLAWAALAGRGVDQAWIVHDVQEILPAHRKRVNPLAGGAPPLWEWAERLKGTNDLVLLLAPAPEAVRPELVQIAVPISVEPSPLSTPSAPRPAPPSPTAPPPLDPPPGPSATAPAPAPDVETAPAPPAAQPGPAPALNDEATGGTRHPQGIVPPKAPEKEPPAPDAVHLALEEALQQSLASHPPETWSSRLPILIAVARVLQTHDPRVSAEGLGVGEDGITATSPGAMAFLERWRSDIALEAAAGMLLGSLAESPPAAPPYPLDPVALRVLAKRTRRLMPG